jgi:hypothetical protein
MLGIPNPVAYPCANCGEPAVLAEYPTGLLPVHCGTYRAACRPPRRGGTRNGSRPGALSRGSTVASGRLSRRSRTVSGPPRPGLLTGVRGARHERPRLDVGLTARHERSRPDAGLRAAAAELARRVAHLTAPRH